MRTILVALAALVAAAPTLAQDDLTGYTGTVTLQGSVMGSNRAEIRVYRNGLVIAQGESDVAGDYSVAFETSGSRDASIVVWFLPDDTTKVPELLIIKESSEARRNRVWSPCIPRRKAADVINYPLQFRTERQLLNALEDSDCFDQ